MGLSENMVDQIFVAYSITYNNDFPIRIDVWGILYF
jgi:hypothetical protein